MASDAPSYPQESGHSYDTAGKSEPIEENNMASTSPSQKQTPSDAAQIHDEEPSYTVPAPTEPASMENKLRPAADILNRIIWDPRFDSTNYTIGYEDRFEGRLEATLGSWKKDLTDEEFIPQHRIIYIKRNSDEEIVWDRRRRIDKIFNSGNSAFSYLSFLS